MIEKTLIGRCDRVDLPELGIIDLPAKVDTGAAGCAIHCHYLKIVKKDGKEYLQIKFLDPSHGGYHAEGHFFENFGRKTVKNSFGGSQERYVIKTGLKLFNREFEIDFSLSNRKNLKYPVLLGRKFLRKGFVVDVKKKDLSYKQKIKKS